MRIIGSLAAAGTGAALMYWADPQNGRRRRASIQNQAVHAVHSFNNATDIAARDASNRIRGALAEMSAALRRQPVDEPTLVARVRSALGRVCSHPHAVQVSAQNGTVDVQGHVLESERDEVLRAIRHVRGVQRVNTDRLVAHDSPEGIPELQGPTRPRRHVPELLQERWSPSARLLTLTGGALVSLWGLGHKNPLGAAAAIVGAGFVLRSATNMPLRRALGIAPGESAIDVRKSIELDVPVSEAFTAMNAFQLFPCFMRHVKRVTENGPDRYHWTVTGPAGVEVEWDARVTRVIPEKLIHWRTEPGATVEHAGELRFDPTRSGGTRLSISMSYRPPGGAVGHLLARILGADPKKQMDEDLVRLKSLLEDGCPTTSQSVSDPGKILQ